MEQSGILVLNAGSSSIKFLFFAERRGELSPVIRGQVEALHTAPASSLATPTAGCWPRSRGAKASRWGMTVPWRTWPRFCRSTAPATNCARWGTAAVHGGLDTPSPVRADRDVLAALEKLVPLAPLHQPHNLAPIRVLLERRPQLPQVACFDTAFHATHPAARPALRDPRRAARRGRAPLRLSRTLLRVRRFGAALARPRAAAGRSWCHLGNGASMCALAGGSIASTMGFTAVDGLPMGTRAGALDAGVLLYLMDERKMDARAIEKLIYSSRACSACRASRATCASCSSRTMRAPAPRWTCSSTASGANWARWWPRSVDWTRWCSPPASARTARPSASGCAATPRGRSCFRRAGECRRQAVHQRVQSRVSAWVVPTNEELMIARHTQRLLGA